MSWMTSLSLARCNFSHFESLQLNYDTPEISTPCSWISVWDTSNKSLYSCFSTWTSHGVQILGVILSKIDRCMRRWSHEYSPNERILVNFFHLFVWKAIQYFPQPLNPLFLCMRLNGQKGYCILLSSPSHCQHVQVFIVGTRRPVQAVGFSRVWLGFPCHGHPAAALDLVSSRYSEVKAVIFYPLTSRQSQPYRPLANVPHGARYARRWRLRRHPLFFNPKYWCMSKCWCLFKYWFLSKYWCGLASLARFPCHGWPPCCPRSGVLVPLLRVRHSVALNEAFSLISWTGVLRSLFNSHFVIFWSEFHRAWRYRRRWHRWWPRTAPRYQISNWHWLGDDMFIAITLLLSLRHTFRATLRIELSAALRAEEVDMKQT